MNIRVPVVLLSLLSSVCGQILPVRTIVAIGGLAFNPVGNFEEPCDPPNYVNVTDEICVSGYPTAAHYFEALAKPTDVAGVVRVMGTDELSKITLYHPRHWELNLDVWKRLDIDFGVLRSPGMFTQPVYYDDALRFLNNKHLPVVASNIDLQPYYYVFDLVDKIFIKDVGGTKFGYIAIWGDLLYIKTYTYDLVLPSIAERLRSLGAEVVILLCIGQAKYFTTPTTLVRFNIDAVLLPAEYTDVTTPVVSNGTTLLVGTLERGASHALQYIDAVKAFDSLLGRMTWRFTSTNINMATPLTPAQKEPLIQKGEYDWIQTQRDLSLANDPVVGQCTHDLQAVNDESEVYCRYQECVGGNMVADACARRLPTVDVCFPNAGALRRGWDAGPVHASDVTTFFPYANTLCELNTTGAGIWEILEVAVANIGTDGNLNSSNRISGGYLQVSEGFKYSYNWRLPRGQRITSISIKGKPLDRRRYYTLGALSYLCSGGDSFPTHVAVPRSITYFETISAHAVISEYLRTNNPYTPKLEERIVVNDFGEPLLLKRLLPTDCNSSQVFVPEFGSCDECPEGYFHPLPGSDPCILEPLPPSPPLDNAVIIVPAVVVPVMLLLAISFCFKLQRDGAKAKRVKHAPKGNGEIAFVFTDIQASSTLWSTEPTAMSKALETHHRLIRELIDQFEGYEVKTIGDAFMVAFSNPINAVAFSCEMQLELANASWPERIMDLDPAKTEPHYSGLRVRVGVHCGPAKVNSTPQGGFDYDGGTVNASARIGDCGCGGQVLISDTVYDLIEPHIDVLNHNVDVKYLGEYHLRGIAEPMGILQIMPEPLNLRAFGNLRGVTPISEEEAVETPADVCVVPPDTGTVLSEKSEALGYTKRDRIVALQTIRKYALSFGPRGMPFPTATSLLCHCLETRSLKDSKLISILLLHAQDGARPPPLSNVPGRGNEYVVHIASPSPPGGQKRPQLSKGISNNRMSTSFRSPKGLVDSGLDFASPETHQTDSPTDLTLYLRWAVFVEVLHQLPTACICQLANKIREENGNISPGVSMDHDPSPISPTSGIVALLPSHELTSGGFAVPPHPPPNPPKKLSA